jgi:hypothetical protein
MIWSSMAVFALAWSGSAQADLVYYTEEATLSGSLGGTAYSTPVTFTILANTSNVMSLGGGNFSVIPTSTTLSLGSGGSATFTDALKVLLYQGGTGDPGGFFELEDTTVGTEILTDYPGSPGFSNALLTTAFGPVTGSTAFDNSAPDFMTSAGAFQINGSSSQTTVTAAMVPEPTSLALTSIAGLISLAVVRLVRDRKSPRR